MLATLISDISFCHKTEACGWAGWVKTTRGVSKTSGPLKTKIHSKDTAIREAMAVVNALHGAIKSGIVHKGDIILVQTDNTGVEGILRRRSKRKAHDQVHDAMKRLCDENSLTWFWRHIKGHSGTRTPRTAVHDEVDRESRRHMIQQRQAANPTYAKRLAAYKEKEKVRRAKRADEQSLESDEQPPWNVDNTTPAAI